MLSPYEDDITACVKVLNAGGLILYPTDTIWGIGCVATNSTAVEKLFELKKRPGEKAMIVLLADEKDILQYITQPDPRMPDHIRGMDKPTTVIYEGAVGFAANLLPADGTMAIRVVKDDFCRHLIRRFGKPIVSTSANISGYPPPRLFTDIDVVIKDGVDHIVSHRQDDTQPAQPSSIIKWNADGSLTVIRS
jgi:L-threonylcarbamoyladenylate synthase